MHVIVDGIVYARQRFGGINTYFNEVLPRLARYPDTRVDLLTPRRHEGEVWLERMTACTASRISTPSAV